MITCHCNYITEAEIEDVVLGFLRQDPWQLVVPNKVYHEIGKRGRCCGCFPSVIDIIVRTTLEFHGKREGGNPDGLDRVLSRLDEFKTRLTAARNQVFVA
ncbi:(2Fe-2S)-binding protein [Agrobacterium salinitolerans]|nr:(2Fe-2S)-binding protein [Agrobacterium salinitolerans]